MMQFKAFKPEAMNKIAKTMGYSGDMNKFQEFIEQDPQRQQQMNMYTNAARRMARGGVVKMQSGGFASFVNSNVTVGGSNPFTQAQQNVTNIQNQLSELQAQLAAQEASGRSISAALRAAEDYPAQEAKLKGQAMGIRTAIAETNRQIRALQGQQTQAQQALENTPGYAEAQAGATAQQNLANAQARMTELQRLIDNENNKGNPDTNVLNSMIAELNQLQQTGLPQAQQALSQAQQSYTTAITPIQPAGGGGGMPPASTGPTVQAPGMPGGTGLAGGATPTPTNTATPGNPQQIQALQNQIASLQAQAQGAVGNAATQLTSQIAGLQSQLSNLQAGTGGTIGGSVSGTGTIGGVPVSGTVTGSPTGVAGSGTVGGVPVSGSVGTAQAPSVATTGATGQQGTPIATVPTPQANQPGIQPFTIQQMYSPGVPVGGETVAQLTQTDPSQDVPSGVGALTGQIATPTAMATTGQAQMPSAMQANTMTAAQSAPAINTAMQATQAAQANPVDPRAQVTAAQQTASSVGNLQAAQGNATLINNPVQRQIQAGELITGTGVDAAAAAAVTAQTQAAAATANPSAQALVQNQLDGLMQQFVGGNTPAWAAGAIRNANAAMAQRGLGASSLAGQAIVQAAMESALPIAQADAQTVAKFESQNLSNRQQAAILAAEQRARFIGQEFDQAFQMRVQNAARIADVANQNFTAEQQVQLENSRVANTMNLQNLSNTQALVMANASALAQLDVANLSNRQQAAVQNAQAFLQIDMANLSNRQQTDLFKAQQRAQSLFTDTAAANASRQFNASSQNQVDQFFANLSSQVAQFNATQQNAQSQFNAGQTNTIARFNAELNNQRDQFNAQNQLVIAQSNAQWRRQIATADTAAINRTNELNANAILDISKQAYSNLWNYYADTMEWAWTSAENQIDRNNALAIAELDAATRSAVAAEGSSSAAGNAVGSLIGTLGSAWILSCWVAREVYGSKNVQWFIFRTWLQYDAPKWFKTLYMTHGEKYAKLISKVPPLKWATKKLMDMVVEKKKRKHHVSCAY